MRNILLAVLAMFTLSACNTVDGAGEDLSTAWNNVTNFGSEGALKDYTALISKHSKESWANASTKIVDLCKFDATGMSFSDLTQKADIDYDAASKCWEALLAYPSTDVRFFKDGSIEKEVLAEFESKKEEYSALFNTK